MPEQRRIAIIMEKLSLVPGEHVLDVGCGVGTFAFHAAKEEALACGIDYSFESLKAARQLTARYPLKGCADFVQGVATSLPFSNAVFDKITVVDFIEHITHEEKATLLLELKRVLKKDGRVVIYTPNKIREDIGEFYWKMRHFLFGHKIPKNESHYGLISCGHFERLLRQHGFSFVFCYHDVTRPYLANIPFFRRYISLNLLWIARKD